MKSSFFTIRLSWQRVMNQRPYDDSPKWQQDGRVPLTSRALSPSLHPASGSGMSMTCSAPGSPTRFSSLPALSLSCLTVSLIVGKSIVGGISGYVKGWYVVVGRVNRTEDTWTHNLQYLCNPPCPKIIEIATPASYDSLTQCRR